MSPSAETTSAANTPRWRRPRYWLPALAIAAAAAGGIYYSQSQTATGAPDAATAQGGGKRGGGGNRPTPVLMAVAKSGDVAVNLNGLGTALPRNTVTVKSRVDGQLMRLAFTEGQMVKAGALLAEIDPRPFQVQLTQAQGQMAKDQALLQNARIDLERYRTLFAQDSIAKQQLDTQQALVRQYEGTVEADQGQVDSAQLQLSYSRVTAPIAGQVGLRQVDAGNIVHASDANGLVTITQVQPMTVVFSLPEDAVPALTKRLRAGEKLTVAAYDREQKNKLADGLLLTADNQIDPTTGTVKLKAQFANDDHALFPNQFVYVRLTLETRRGVVQVPSAAIQRGKQNNTFVYVIQDDQSVTVRPVKLGPVDGEISAIDEGLALGEKVVADGADKLREGSKVEAQLAGARGGNGERRRGAGKPGGAKADGAKASEAPAGTPPAPVAQAAEAKPSPASITPATETKAGEGHGQRRPWDPEKAAEWRKRRGGE